jgi:hypothetical protein
MRSGREIRIRRQRSRDATAAGDVAMKQARALIACSMVGLSAACSSPATVRDGTDSGTPAADPDGGIERPTPDVDSGPMMPPPMPPPAPDPIDCATAEVARFAGVVTALSDRAPLVGARVCVLDHPEIPCATTSATGFYELACAPIGDAAISFEADGFAPGVWMWAGRAGETPESLDISLARVAENTAYLAPTGITYPAGSLSLVTIDLVGDVAGLSGAVAVGEGQGPFFSVDEGGRIDPAATGPSSDTELMFFVVEPHEGWSEVEIELLPTAGTECRQLGGAWPSRSGAANTMRVLVRPGWESVIWARCE